MSRRFIQSSWAEPDLFICADEALFESAEGAHFQLCPMEKESQPVFLPTATWEGGDGQRPLPNQQDMPYGSIVYDAQLEEYVFWYMTGNRLLALASDPALGQLISPPLRPQGSGVCIATSKDGIEWRRPDLGQVLFNQSFRNNMIRVDVPPVMSDHLSAVVPNYIEGHETELVGSVYSNFQDPIYPRGITAMFSDDGVQWRPHWPPTLPLDGDAHCVMWDPRRRCYLCTTRSAQHSHVFSRLRSRGFDTPYKRHVALAMSRDMVHWTPMLDVLEADEQDAPNAQMYYMYILPYGHAYLGFVQMFYPTPDMAYGPQEMQLAISTDLINWRRVGRRRPILPRGKPQSWDQSQVSLCPNPPFLVDGRLRFWYGGKDTEHWQAGTGGLGAASLRQDGFACWEAGAAGGTVTTRLLKINWATMPYLNVDAAGGEARMEILDEENKPIAGCSAEDCFPITVDSPRAPLAFKPGRGTFIRHSGRVRFRFHLKSARLYAFKLPNVEI
jgi:hypothetical protein